MTHIYFIVSYQSLMQWREIYAQLVNMNFQNAVQINLKPVLFHMLFLTTRNKFYLYMYIPAHYLYMVSTNCNFIWFTYKYIAGYILNF